MIKVPHSTMKPMREIGVHESVSWILKCIFRHWMCRLAHVWLFTELHTTFHFVTELGNGYILCVRRPRIDKLHTKRTTAFHHFVPLVPYTIMKLAKMKMFEPMYYIPQIMLIINCRNIHWTHVVQFNNLQSVHILYHESIIKHKIVIS